MAMEDACLCAKPHLFVLAIISADLLLIRCGMRTRYTAVSVTTAILDMIVERNTVQLETIHGLR